MTSKLRRLALSPGMPITVCPVSEPDSSHAISPERSVRRLETAAVVLPVLTRLSYYPMARGSPARRPLSRRRRRGGAALAARQAGRRLDRDRRDSGVGVERRLRVPELDFNNDCDACVKPVAGDCRCNHLRVRIPVGWMGIGLLGESARDSGGTILDPADSRWREALGEAARGPERLQQLLFRFDSDVRLRTWLCLRTRRDRCTLPHRRLRGQLETDRTTNLRCEAGHVRRPAPWLAPCI